MKRSMTIVMAVLFALAMMVGPAAAHVNFVSPPGQGDGPPEPVWVGGPALPGSGQGLIAGGPTGEDMLAPAHAKGLNVACESLEGNPSVANIRGPAATPPATWGCPHGE